MNCWCGGKTRPSFHLEYSECLQCGTFVSNVVTPPGFYGFDYYWHERQEKINGFPPIEKRAETDMEDRVPYQWGLVKDFSMSSVFEIGCSHGGFLYKCQKEGIPFCLGMEVSEGTAAFAKERFGINVMVGKFPEDSMGMKDIFDVVCGFDVLEHMRDPLKALGRMKELGRHVVVQVPLRQKNNSRGFVGIAHQYVFTKDSFQRLFSTAGLEILKTCRGFFEGDCIQIGRTKR